MSTKRLTAVPRDGVRISEIARSLGLNYFTVREWVAKGLLSHTRVGRSIFIPAGELDRLLKKNLIPASDKRRRR